MDSISVGGAVVSTSETDGVHRPLTVSTLDNLGETLASYRFDGDGVSMVDKNRDGVPDALDHDGELMI